MSPAGGKRSSGGSLLCFRRRPSFYRVGEGVPRVSPGALLRLFGEAPSPTAIDGKRGIVQLRETDPDAGGQYALKRWHVARYGDSGGVQEIELRSENADFKSIVLSARDADIYPVVEFLELASQQ